MHCQLFSLYRGSKVLELTQIRIKKSRICCHGYMWSQIFLASMYAYRGIYSCQDCSLRTTLIWIKQSSIVIIYQVVYVTSSIAQQIICMVYSGLLSQIPNFGILISLYRLYGLNLARQIAQLVQLSYRFVLSSFPAQITNFYYCCQYLFYYYLALQINYRNQESSILQTSPTTYKVFYNLIRIKQDLYYKRKICQYNTYYRDQVIQQTAFCYYPRSGHLSYAQGDQLWIQC